MTGIVILPAGRDDAFEDYKRFVRDGHPIDDIESYLDEDDLELFRTTSDDDLVHVWGTSVAGTWRNVERNDIVLVYHDGKFVARGQVLQLRHDPNLAEHLWKKNVDHGRWDDESPWEYMTFLTDVEEVDVDIEEFNELTGRDLADFVAWRRDDIAPVTLQKQLSTVRMALRYWADIEGVTEGLAEKLHSPELPDGSEARDIHLETQHATEILEYLDRYAYASRRHVVISLLWRTGMRRSALRSIDLDDLRPEEHAIVLEHRTETDTILKNHEDGERWVYLGPRWYQIVDDYIDKNRIDVTDDHGREPLITTRCGRPTGDTIYTWVNMATQPCEYGRDCPHDRDPNTCEANSTDGYPSRCPSSRSPHGIRRGSITYHLTHGTSPEVASERMDVSLEVLYKHYDARDKREKMSVRKDNIPDI